MGTDAREDVFEPGERIDPDPLARGQEAPQHGSRVATLVAAKEHPVVATHRDTADGALGGVIIDLQISVLAVAGQCCPVLQSVADGPPLWALGQYLRLDLPQVVTQLIQDGTRLELAKPKPIRRPQRPHLLS